MNNYITKIDWQNDDEHIASFIEDVYSTRRLERLCEHYTVHDLAEAFTWSSSPQGSDFWMKYNTGHAIDDDYFREIKRLYDITRDGKDPAFKKKFEEVYDPSDYDDNCI